MLAINPVSMNDSPYSAYQIKASVLLKEMRKLNVDFADFSEASKSEDPEGLEKWYLKQIQHRDEEGQRRFFSKFVNHHFLTRTMQAEREMDKDSIETLLWLRKLYRKELKESQRLPFPKASGDAGGTSFWKHVLAVEDNVKKHSLLWSLTDPSPLKGFYSKANSQASQAAMKSEEGGFFLRFSTSNPNKIVMVTAGAQFIAEHQKVVKALKKGVMEGNKKSVTLDHVCYGENFEKKMSLAKIQNKMDCEEFKRKISIGYAAYNGFSEKLAEFAKTAEKELVSVGQNSKDGDKKNVNINANQKDQDEEWVCSFCTMINDPQTSRCVICYGTRAADFLAWNCPACTFLNKNPASMACEICQTAKPVPVAG